MQISFNDKMNFNYVHLAATMSFWNLHFDAEMKKNHNLLADFEASGKYRLIFFKKLRKTGVIFV